MNEIVLPNDTNPLGALLGGRRMHWIDLAGALAAQMEVGVKVWVENYLADESRHVSSAYLTSVAIDAAGRHLKVPAVIPETEEQRRL
jgi:acyl-CoA hydrolase